MRKFRFLQSIGLRATKQNGVPTTSLTDKGSKLMMPFTLSNKKISASWAEAPIRANETQQDSGTRAGRGL